MNRPPSGRLRVVALGAALAAAAGEAPPDPAEYAKAVILAWHNQGHRAMRHLFPEPDPRVVPGLVGLAGDRDADRGKREDALRALGWLGSHAAAAAALETAALGLSRDADPAVRLNALRFRLGRKGLDREAVAGFEACLDAKEASIRLEAVWMLDPPARRERLGDEERAGLEALLPALARAASDAEAARGQGDASPIPALFEERSSRLPVADAAWSALGEIRRPLPGPCTRAVAGVAREGSPEWARLRALRFLGECGPAAGAEAPVLKEAVRDSSEKIRFEAARALALVDPSAAGGKPVLLAALASTERDVPGEALQALARLRPVGRDVLDAVRDRLGSSDAGTVSHAAARVTALLGPEGAPLAPDLYRAWKASDPKSPGYERWSLATAIAAVAPGSGEALSMWREAIHPAREREREILRAVVASARGASLLPALGQDLADRSDAGQARRYEALAALGAMPPAAAAEALALLRAHGEWLATEDRAGRNRYAERDRLNAALRALETPAR